MLGEQFIGKWSDKDGIGETELVAEQVSHHPPVTAYWIHNAKAGVTLEGHSGQKTAFSGRCINVKQVGHATLRVANSSGGEDLYLITLPCLVIEGLWYGEYVGMATRYSLKLSSCTDRRLLTSTYALPQARLTWSLPV